jgi:5-methylthioadenosine/S-adenosylhomocysteine deaminase
MSILIQQGTVLLPSGTQTGLSVAIEGDRIAKIAPDIDPAGFDTVIDAKGQLVMPGLVNAHTHLAMVLFRGFADDMALQPWLEEMIWPAEAKLNAEQVYWASMWGCIELIRGGVTNFCDMYFYMDETAKAVQESGLRALLTYGMIAFEPNDKMQSELDTCVSFADAWQGKADGRIRTALAPHAQYTCCDELWEATLQIAHDKNYWINTHLSETRKEVDVCREQSGKSPVAYLNDLGVFDLPTLTAHCVHVDEADINILADKNVHISHNPGSNLKLGSGIAPLPELLQANINVALGTDGTASNNNLNMFEEMHMAAMLHKGTHEDALAIPSDVAAGLATENGYRALGFDNGGKIEEGALADVILVDLTQNHLEPVYNPSSALVYSAQASDVTTTIVNGQVLMRDKKLLAINEEEVRSKINEYAMHYRRS